MTLDIRGGLKITKLSRNPYVVFEELISNAIDSFLIRRNGGEISNKLEINIVVNFFKKDLIVFSNAGLYSILKGDFASIFANRFFNTSDDKS